MFENIMNIVMSLIFIGVGRYVMIKHKKLAEAFIVSDKAFREVMGWHAHKNSKKMFKFQSVFLLVFGLIFVLVSMLALFCNTFH